ncbi:MAG: ornithine carbamoyltransferase [Actinobacteria bacterium]|uniref:ornithine carbamoyltransferase n=1 Tax=freshwater metagenome TaxID=449393 RepID=A0A6J7CU45_9ZZZZ|nr:ornithine carbamoyltransferase [Actinomycetota bacterium]
MARHFRRDDDITPAEQQQIIDMAIAMKADPYSQKPLAGPKSVALVFDKPSTRTRVSFSVGVADLGGNPLIIQAGESQLGAKESVADTARVLERMVAAIVWRTFAQSDIDEMAAHSAVPVINSLSDDFHPCQLLADLMTIREHKGRLAGLTVAFVGDGSSNMANSYLVACAMAGMHVRVASPANYQPLVEAHETATRIASETGGSVLVTVDVAEALVDADVVVTDTWISMGQESDKEQRIADFAGYGVTSKLLAAAKGDAIFLHCLPAYRGYEVDADVIDGPQSVVWDAAENRLHAQKALLHFLLTAS